MIVSLSLADNVVHEKKKPHIYSIYIQESNQQYLSNEIYIYTLPITVLYCSIFELIFDKLYSKQTQIGFNIRCFKISIGNFHLIFIICPYMLYYLAVIETYLKTEKSSTKQFLYMYTYFSVN